MANDVSRAHVQVRRRPRREEDALQKAAVTYLRSALSSDQFRIAAIPNGGRRSKIEAAIMKGLGTLSGMPDLQIVGPLGTVYFIECKAAAGRMSHAQKDFRDFCARNSIPHIVTKSLDDVIAAAADWGLTRRAAA